MRKVRPASLRIGTACADAAAVCRFQWQVIDFNEPAIEYVWIDFSCMPQGANKSDEEHVEFKFMLKNINFLYIGIFFHSLFQSHRRVRAERVT